MLFLANAVGWKREEIVVCEKEFVKLPPLVKKNDIRQPKGSHHSSQLVAPQERC